MSEIFPESPAAPGATFGEVYWAAANEMAVDSPWGTLSGGYRERIERGAQAVADAASTQPKPATVIVVTEEGGKERRYAADGFTFTLFGLIVTSGGKQVARYLTGTYRFAREEGATLPDTAERQALQDIIRMVDALNEPGPAADMIRLEAMRGLGQQVDAEDECECDSAGQGAQQILPPDVAGFVERAGIKPARAGAE